MKDINIYKIHDTDLEEYSQYIVTSKPCKELIKEAILVWQDDVYCEDWDNIFDCIETFLSHAHIDYKWVKFDDNNTINF